MNASICASPRATYSSFSPTGAKLCNDNYMLVMVANGIIVDITVVAR